MIRPTIARPVLKLTGVIDMNRVCEKFELKLVEYATALKEYNDAHALFQKDWPRSQERLVMKRLVKAGKDLDRLRGPMHTALDRLALNIV